MPAPDDRLPVIVGVSRLTPRVTDAAAAPTPLDTLEHVVRAAADDAGPRALAAVDTVTTLLTAFWNETDPGAAVAQRLGLAPRRTVVVGNGGEVGVRALNWLADEILAGRVGTAFVLFSVEVSRTRWRPYESDHSFDMSRVFRLRARREGTEALRRLRFDGSDHVLFRGGRAEQALEADSR